MLVANYIWLRRLLGGIGGTADSDWLWDEYGHINVDDEIQSKEALIRPLIKPYFDAWDLVSKDRARLALSHALSVTSPGQGARLFTDTFDDAFTVFDTPTNARLFFLWMWEELFPGENWLLQNASNYVTGFDLAEIDELRVDPWDKKI